MNRATLNRGLGVALVVSVSLNIAASGRRARPNFEYFPDMARTARYNAFEENPNFADGMTLRTPVPGTIPRGRRPTGETNPFSAGDPGAAGRGAQVFTDFCQPCHGADARGVGPVVQHGFPPPPPLSRGQTQEKTDAELFRIVSEGIRTMPPYAVQLSPDDRWKVILHVRTFKR